MSLLRYATTRFIVAQTMTERFSPWYGSVKQVEDAP
jgi:hypothetical protein